MPRASARLIDVVEIGAWARRLTRVLAGYLTCLCVQICDGESQRQNLRQGKQSSFAWLRLTAAMCSLGYWARGAVFFRMPAAAAADMCNRYGWTPDEYSVPAEPGYDWVRKYPSGRSITELEIQRATLNADEDRSVAVKESIFFIRSEKFLEDVPTQHMATFCDGEVARESGSLVFRRDMVKKEKMDALTARVCNAWLHRSQVVS